MTLFEMSSGCKMHTTAISQKCKFLALGKWKDKMTQGMIPHSFFSLSDHLDFLGVQLKATGFFHEVKRNGRRLLHGSGIRAAQQSSARSGALPLEAGRTLQTVLERGSEHPSTENRNRITPFSRTASPGDNNTPRMSGECKNPNLDYAIKDKKSCP